MKIYLVGIGMGDCDTLTKRAEQVINEADIIIGAKRVTENISSGKTIFNSYKAEEIADYLKNRQEESAAVLLSGDIGFYSGAKRLIEVLKDYETELIPGISSAVYFCARLKTEWEDAKLLSLHGKTSNAIGYIRRYKKVFMILSGNDSIKELCSKLCYYNMGDIVLHIGQRLSYSDEKIITVKAEDIKEFDFDNLSVVLAENTNPVDLSMSSIKDDAFVRGDVPMTKSEIRTLSIGKLCLNTDSILYDIGSGTGSVAVEAGLKLIDGQVYAIERNEKALELIERNKRKFVVDNIIVVKGTAPDVIADLPMPTHIFIGGSGGNLVRLIDCVLKKNPKVKIVVNVIALNTLAEIIKIIEDKGLDADIVSINAAKDRLAGNYRLMTAHNPVYIITINQDGDSYGT